MLGAILIARAKLVFPFREIPSICNTNIEAALTISRPSTAHQASGITTCRRWYARCPLVILCNKPFIQTISHCCIANTQADTDLFRCESQSLAIRTPHIRERVQRFCVLLHSILSTCTLRRYAVTRRLMPNSCLCTATLARVQRPSVSGPLN